MATFHDRTLAPKFQGRLLRAAGSCAVLTSGEVVVLVADVPELPTTPLARHDTAPVEPDTADLARTLHLRRQLEEAAEHGVALLAALGLPRIAEPAIGPALDLVIAALDEIDGDTDLEDGGDAELSLGWTAHIDQRAFALGYNTEDEMDTADAEPSLASPERHPSVPEHPCSFVYRDTGPESSQLRWAEGAQHDREAVNEDGDELDLGEHDECDKEPSLGWPNDFTAVLSGALQADHDPELDDADIEGDEPGADVWVFGPSRQERAHV